MAWSPKDNQRGGVFAGLGYTSPTTDSPLAEPDITFSRVPLATDNPPYLRLPVNGIVVGLLNTSDPGAELEIAIEEPTAWCRIGAGDVLPPASRPFNAIFIRRPAGVPADTGRSYRIFTSSDRSVTLGPLPPRALAAGADTWTITGPAAAGKAQLVAAKNGRRLIKVRNISAAIRKIGIDAAGNSITLNLGELWEAPYAGVVFGDGVLATDYEIQEFS